LIPPRVENPDEPAPWEHWIKQQDGAWFSVVDDFLPRQEPSIALIQRACCKHFALQRKDFLSPRRGAELVYARQIGMFICKRETSKSLPEIGRRFGDRDHTTVLYAVRKIANQSKYDHVMVKDIEAITIEIKGINHENNIPAVSCSESPGPALQAAVTTQGHTHAPAARPDDTPATQGA
jgi:hypothetical protein